jgi:hypothetical protein
LFYNDSVNGSVTMVTFQEVHELMAQANLIVQLAVFLLIILSLVLERKKILVWHGNTMLVAVMVSTLLLISHMGPAFFSVLQEAATAPDVTSGTGLIHGLIGAVAIFLGVWLVGAWAYVGSETYYCARKKSLMRKILLFWLVTLGLGFLYYALHIILG